MRTNTYKEKIIKILKKNHLLSISDIHKKISEADYSTVYRNIEQLISENEIKKIIFDKDNIMYEINDTEHSHDHFICNDCGSVDKLERNIMNLDFIKNHNIKDVLVRGLCQKCN